VIPLSEIEAARQRLAGAVVRTPLVRLELDDAPAEIYLKLENLQPIGAFKLRGAGNALLLAAPEELARGVWTASAGNMAQGVAWWARRLGVRCTCVVPDTAPETKLTAIRRLGSEIVAVPFDVWWEFFRTL
jgi:threonine dehydratase